MTQPTCTVPGCGRPCPDQAYVCPSCGAGLVAALAHVAPCVDDVVPADARTRREVRDKHGRIAGDVEVIAPGHGGRASGERPAGQRGNLLEDLEVAATRQARLGAGGVRSSGERPVPWDDRPARAAHRVRAAIIGWAAYVAEGRGEPWPSSDPAQLAAWLTRHVDWLRHRADDGPRAVDDITGAVDHALRIIDRPPPTRYLGPCVCGVDLYAPAAAAVIVCTGCGTTHDVARRQGWLLTEAEDALAPAFLIARAVTVLGQAVRAGTIRQWAARGRLLERARDKDGHPLYRVGDVIDLAAKAAAQAS